MILQHPKDAWRGFDGRDWRDAIDVAAFLRDNVTPYSGGPEFLVGPTQRTDRSRRQLQRTFAEERRRGIDDLVTHPRPATHRKTHSAAAFDAYPADVLAARRSHIITGLPDAYARGRIIGDYRRVALYGVDRLIAERRSVKAALDGRLCTDDVIRNREELAEQVRALIELKVMAASDGVDISRPAGTARQAIQWLYFAYLAAAQEPDGATMSLGSTSTFVDVYLQRDLDEGTLTETAAQELIDDFVIKLRTVPFPRTPGYDELFSGDPSWITESLGGLGADARPLVTRTSFRYLQTLYNLGPAPEPNLTVRWSPRLPEGFKRFCAQVSLDTSAIQYENDDLIRSADNDDTAIACCVSATRVGKDLQFFGPQANLAKALLYAINGGRDELSGEQVAPATMPIDGDVLDYQQVDAAFDGTLDWLAKTYVDALNIINYMQDKYAYERLEMALQDHPVRRFLATGVAGLSVAVDGLSAIKHAHVKVLRDTTGLAVDYAVDGDFPTFGNNDDRADAIAVDLVERFMAKIRRQPTYRGAEPTLSVLTGTSNVVHGKHTGSTPDGRWAGEPFTPGADPVHGRHRHALVAAALSAAKLPYRCPRDGISVTTTVTPDGLGHTRAERIDNLAGILDQYTAAGGFHFKINILDPATPEDATAPQEKD